MVSDPKTCTSDHVSFDVKQVPAYKHGASVSASALVMHCLTCEKYAMAMIDGFSESSVAEAWNAHHARQMAERVAEIAATEQKVV